MTETVSVFWGSLMMSCIAIVLLPVIFIEYGIIFYSICLMQLLVFWTVVVVSGAEILLGKGVVA